jgi:vacuolar protein sorting-associated protein 54
MLRDAEYFNTRLSALDGAGDTGEYIVNIVKEKSVPKAATAEDTTATNGSEPEAKRSSGDSKGEEKSEEKDAEKAA